MHPAPSVILFTTLSGLGFGLLVFLGLGYPGSTGWVAFVFFALAYLLAVGGLLASTFHLGHPERALKAFTQWRSSWLSREAWCAVGGLVVMSLVGIGRVFFDSHWMPLGVIGAILCLATILTTSMIYTQLKTVPRWNTPLTPMLFLAYALAGGSLLAGQIDMARILLSLAAAIQLAWWITGENALERSGSSLDSATGLGPIGTTRAFEPPHTGTNYLTREMVFVVGRAHAKLLRLVAILLAFAIPVIVLTMPFSHMMAGLAVLSHVAGVLVARWLFFAEAEHVVGLYYGQR
ncbi:MAG: DmsC/YnfH family molybdoenzyme membrane anchor subunit [Aestuariivita sp.]|uniref:dimethyl sulfoxide reductase anchor subunit family protein n=1 Tax=Aestuariivita sp. TaxID=1872407 RepID=UPI003BB20185